MVMINACFLKSPPGAFPFGFFATNFNFGEERPGPPQAGSHQAAEEAFLHKIFLWVTFVMQDLKRWHLAKPFRWRLPSYSGYWLPERGGRGRIPLAMCSIDIWKWWKWTIGRGSRISLTHKKNILGLSASKSLPLFLLICWPGDISAVNLDRDNELKLKKTEKWKCLIFFKIWGTWTWRRQKSESVKVYSNFGGPVQFSWKLSRAYFCDSYYNINI